MGSKETGRIKDSDSGDTQSGGPSRWKSTNNKGMIEDTELLESSKDTGRLKESTDESPEIYSVVPDLLEQKLYKHGTYPFEDSNDVEESNELEDCTPASSIPQAIVEPGNSFQMRGVGYHYDDASMGDSFPLKSMNSERDDLDPLQSFNSKQCKTEEIPLVSMVPKRDEPDWMHRNSMDCPLSDGGGPISVTMGSVLDTLSNPGSVTTTNRDIREGEPRSIQTTNTICAQ